MLIFKRLFRFYINASIHVAFAVVSLYMVTVQTLNISINWNLFGFLFFSTIVCYNFVKYGVEAEKYLIVAKPAHRPIQVLSFFVFGLSLFFFFNLSAILWGYIVFLTLVSALYAIPFLPRSRNLRSWGGLKIFLIALIWTGFTCLLPIIDNQLEITNEIFMHGLGRFILVLILILPFEIRDVKYDNPALRTLPQRYGADSTKRLGYLLVLVYLAIGFFWGMDEPDRILYFILVALILFFAIYHTKVQQSRFYASFWVEGIPLVMVLISKGMELLLN